SVDGGVSWVAINTSLPAAVTAGDGAVAAIQIDHGSGTDPAWGTLYAGTDASGVYRSTNGGVSWSEVNTGIAAGDKSITALAVDPLPNQGSNTIYAATATGKVYRTDNGSNWISFDNAVPVPAPPHLPGGSITALSMPFAGAIALYAAVSGVGVYVS